jgi:Uma2 family endonuclease
MTAVTRTKRKPEDGGAVPSDWYEVYEPPAGLSASVIRGELVLTPAPSDEHQYACGRLVVLLDSAVASADPSLVILPGGGWHLDEERRVAMDPQPDVVIRHRADGGHRSRTPVLAVEVISPSDSERLTSDPRLTRIEGKRLDYADHGLTDYLEYDGFLPGAGGPVLRRYELRLPEHRLVLAGQASGDEPLIAERPFPYRLVPSELLL